MANREVNLTKRIQTTGGWRYCPVLLSANGRVKPDVVLAQQRPSVTVGGNHRMVGRNQTDDEA